MQPGYWWPVLEIRLSMAKSENSSVAGKYKKNVGKKTGNEVTTKVKVLPILRCHAINKLSNLAVDG